MPESRDRIAGLVFYGSAVLLAYLVYQLFRPFLVPLAWAVVLTICFYPTHRRLERRWGRSGAAAISTVAVALVVIVPMLAVASAFVSEASRILNEMPTLLGDTPRFALRWLQRAVDAVPGGEALDPAALLAESARRLAAVLSAQAAGVLQDLVQFVVYLIITIFAMFFLFRDADAIMHAVRRTIPLEPAIRERLIEQTRIVVTASVASSLIVAAVQGLLGGLLFWALGLSAPVFWGVVMALSCLLPFGAWVVWAPAAVWLMATGRVVRGLLLAALGLAVVSAVDNVLRPALLSGRSRMNGLLLFIGLLGGIAAFGTVGLVLGPVLMATGVGLLEAFTSEELPPASPTA